MRDNLNNLNKQTLDSQTKEEETRKFKSKTPIIVGFDPGLTVGLAILDLNGSLLFLDSFKEISKSEIITIIMNQGRAIVVATDVEHSPKAVRKLASSLNAKVVSPKHDIPVSYKNELVTEFLKNNISFSNDSVNKEYADNHYKQDPNPIYDSNHNSNKNSKPNYYFNRKYNSNRDSTNDHERDALSAAILAYNNYKKKLNQLERKFLEAKTNINSIDKEDIINENYYDMLNKAKSFLIDNCPISEAISKAFESYGLIDENNNLNGINEYGKENIDNDSGIYDESQTNCNGSQNSHDTSETSYNEEYLSELEEKLDKLKNIKKSQEKQIKNQDKVIELLKNQNKSLSEELNEKNQKIAKINKDLKELKSKESKAILKDKELVSKIKLLKNIQLKYKEEKALRESLEEKLNKRLKLDDFEELSIFTPIKIANSFTKNGLNELNKLFRLKKGDVIYLSSSEGGGSQTAKFLADLKVKAIITSKNNETLPPQAEEVFANEKIPILKEKDLDIKFFDDYAVADSKVLNNEIDKWKKELAEKSTKKAHDDLLNVINEYRVERKRDI